MHTQSSQNTVNTNINIIRSSVEKKEVGSGRKEKVQRDARVSSRIPSPYNFLLWNSVDTSRLWNFTQLRPCHLYAPPCNAVKTLLLSLSLRLLRISSLFLSSRKVLFPAMFSCARNHGIFPQNTTIL